MSQAPLTIRLACKSWAQLERIYRLDLMRSALFLKAASPPPLGTRVSIHLTLPTDTVIVLEGQASRHVAAGDAEQRGPGVDIQLTAVPQSAMWIIESALASAKQQTNSAARPVAVGAAVQAVRQRAAPPTVPQPGAHREQSQPDAGLDDGAAVLGAERELFAALQQEVHAFARMTPHQVLGVPPHATIEQIREAFSELTKRYHPDRFARYQNKELREEAAEIFIMIRNAYAKLSVPPNPAPVRVARVDSRPVPQPQAGPSRSAPVRAAAVPPLPPAVGRPVARPAERLSSTNLFDSGDAPSAQAPPPVDIADERRRVGTGFARAESLLEEGRFDEALALYQAASRRNSADTLARAGLELAEGLRALRDGNRMEAAQRFETVLELDPTNERAAHELAEMRRQATNERKGLLARLLGKE